MTIVALTTARLKNGYTMIYPLHPTTSLSHELDLKNLDLPKREYLLGIWPFNIHQNSTNHDTMISPHVTSLEVSHVSPWHIHVNVCTIEMCGLWAKSGSIVLQHPLCHADGILSCTSCHIQHLTVGFSASNFLLAKPCCFGWQNKYQNIWSIKIFGTKKNVDHKSQLKTCWRKVA